MLHFALVPLMLALAAEPSAVNTLTPKEKADGWRLLFDGKTTSGWRGFKRPDMPAAGWVAEDGMLRRLPTEARVGDIVTVDEYESFELSIEWRIPPVGNSGIKYPVDESMGDGKAGLGFEYQILDNELHPDAKQGKEGNRRAGGLYDLIAPKDAKTNPPGQWNQTRIVIQGKHTEHWLNGKMVVSYERGSKELTSLIAESKYKKIARFGQVDKGHILLQDHGDGIDFRNIKIRPRLSP